MNKNTEAQTNSIKISEDVVAKIAEIAVGNVDGVSAFTKSKVKFSNLFKKDSSEAAIDVQSENGSIDVTVNIVVSYNSKVKKVAERVQEKVKTDVQNMTGIVVSKVNVIVDGISFDD